MKKTRRLRWLLLVLALAASPSFLHADFNRGFTNRNANARSRSHLPIPPLGDGQEMTEKDLAERLAQFRDLTRTQGLLRQILENPDAFGLSAETLRELQKTYKDGQLHLDPSDSRLDKLKEWIRETGPNPSRPNLSEQQIKDLQGLIQEMQKNSSQSEETDPKENDPSTGTPDHPGTGRDSSRDMKTPPRVGGLVFPPKDQNPHGGSGSPEGEEMGTQARIRQWLKEQTPRIQSMLGPLKDSPAFQDALREFSKLGLKEDGLIGQLDDPTSQVGSVLDKFGRFSRQSGLSGLRDWPAFSNFSLPDLPRPSLPQVSIPMPALPSVNLPRVSVPQTPTPGDGLNLLGMLVLLGLLVFLWKLWGRRAEAAGLAAAQDWHPGPWPVAPGMIATRAELIKAFEHLSLLKLGRTAASQHHRAIAAGLCAAIDANSPEGQQAAQHLASLYEQARYAPADEPLTEPALRAARRDLCFLAGVQPR